MNTAVILAGGKSRRMGRDKLKLPFRGKTLLEAAVERFSRNFDNVYVSVADTNKYPYVNARKIEDIYKGCGPLAGLHATLKQTDDEGVFLVAADLPFSDPMAAKKIIQLAGEHDAAMLLDEQGRYEPLFAYYKKSILPAIETLLENGEYRMIRALETFSLRKLTKEDLGSFWNDNLLLNINLVDDYKKLMEKQ
ncbi:MAG: molybdenum cofactor guanylyltransferase [Clostridiales bacterium]|jgi:molybdopterin-guanine dinucleotide biosynthesis protein A|nr:molybdenum cofactor guanylyltransferase [Clostridiales bacterium]